MPQCFVRYRLFHKVSLLGSLLDQPLKVGPMALHLAVTLFFLKTVQVKCALVLLLCLLQGVSSFGLCDSAHLVLLGVVLLQVVLLRAGDDVSHRCIPLLAKLTEVAYVTLDVLRVLVFLLQADFPLALFVHHLVLQVLLHLLVFAEPLHLAELGFHTVFARVFVH
mgnify:CR=1 FL=1